METLTETIHGVRCRRLASDKVELFVSERAGHIGPIRFSLSEQTVASPYSLPPWEPDEYNDLPPMLRILRGDFFCFPFGVSEGFEYAHGETANGVWNIDTHGESYLESSMALTQPAGGKIVRRILLEPGQRAVYQEHVVTGTTGRLNYGHHPILQFPAGVECPVRCSGFEFGQVYPGEFANPAEGEYSSLKRGAEIHRLDRVPLARGGYTSLETYPAREGYEDLVMLSSTRDKGLGWTAVTFPGYVWIALRSVRQFPSTLFWMSNGGRHSKPWCGRHKCRMGVEDVCSHFHDGAHISSADLLAERGVKTSRLFRSDEKSHLRHLQFVHPVMGQPGLAAISYPAPGKVELTFEDGQTAHLPLDWNWLLGPDHSAPAGVKKRAEPLWSR